MTLSGYKREIRGRIRQYLNDNDAWQKDEADLYDELFTADSVTGNASGSYYCNAYKAQQALVPAIFDQDLLNLYLSDYEISLKDLEKGPEWFDVSIRCALLSECLTEVLKQGKYYRG